MARFLLTVNGARHTVDAAPDTPLIYVLRNELRLTGPRLGCGMAQCGSCAVLADGKEIRTCTTTVSQVGSRKITTVEGLPALQRGPDPSAFVVMEIDLVIAGIAWFIGTPTT